jgi:hypothetical protein
LICIKAYVLPVAQVRAMLKLDPRLIRELIALLVLKAAILAIIYLALFAPYRVNPANRVEAALFFPSTTR